MAPLVGSTRMPHGECLAHLDGDNCEYMISSLSNFFCFKSDTPPLKVYLERRAQT
jgi:hypothetical protein